MMEMSSAKITSDDNDNRITLNAMGVKFVVKESLLNSIEPESRLGMLRNYKQLTSRQIQRVCDDYDPFKPEFFFMRDPDVLKLILNYLISGKLHVSADLCEVFVKSELSYWMLDPKKMSRCCKAQFEAKCKSKTEDINVEEEIIEKINASHFKTYSLKEKLWNITQFPNDIELGAYYSKNFKSSIAYFVLTNCILFAWLVIYVFSSFLIAKEFNIDLIDLIAFTFFLMDALFRFIVCPDRSKWLKSSFNVIEIVSVFLYFCCFFLHLVIDIRLINALSNGGKILRVMLFLKLTRVSWRSRTIIKTFKRSYRELLVSIFFILLSLMITSTWMFYIEALSRPTDEDRSVSEPETKMDSIPSTFWWAIVTMSTVGYGDLIPVTPAGKILAGLTIIWGMIVFTLPIAIIGSNFKKIYKKEENRFNMYDEYDEYKMHSRYSF